MTDQKNPVSIRRGFMQSSLLAAASSVLAISGLAWAEDKSAAASKGAGNLGCTPVTLAPLPYDPGALEPMISRKTIEFHYGRHHKAYIDNVAKMTTGTPLEGASLEQIIRQSAASPTSAALFDNAAQAWSHTFYWNSLSPKQQRPFGELNDMIERDFGSLDALHKKLAEAAVSQFGSGWAWLVLEWDEQNQRNRLDVMKTSNADLPFIHGAQPLLAIDVWEHAYYLDYRNRRADYVEAVLAKLINWEFAAENLKRA